METIAELKIGSIVALNSHPYKQNIQNVVISGDPQLLSPLMVVTEILEETKDQHDEHTGLLQVKRGSAQCKCIWFSSKAHLFEEQWINSRLLEIISSNNIINVNCNDIQLGQQVALKTLPTELQKRKSSLSYESNFVTDPTKNPTITSLLSFLSPIMHVIEKKKYESKEPAFDQKSGKQKRHCVSWMLKCKWYNCSSDKMSEKFLPAEALMIIPQTEVSLLEKISEYIEGGTFLSVGDGVSKSLICPKEIVYKAGFYTLRAFDYIVNKAEEFEINSNSFIPYSQSPIINKGPSFDFLTVSPIVYQSVEEEVYQLIIEAQKGKSYIRIKYKSLNDKITFRTLKNYTCIEVSGKMELSALGDRKVHRYLIGYCCTKKEIRTFKINRILKFEELDIKYSDVLE